MRFGLCFRSRGFVLALLCAAGIVLASPAETGQRGDPGFKSGRGNGRLGGKVTDHDGNPLAGLEVRLVFSQIDSLAYRDKTGKKGDFAFAGLGSGMWNLTVFGLGYEIYTASVNVSQVQVNPTVRVKLKKSDAPFAGVIEDPASLADLNKGRQLLDERKFVEALPLLEAFLAKNPTSSGVRLSIADCRREMGQLEKAESDYGALLESAKTNAVLEPDLKARAFLGLGDIKIKQNKVTEAGEFFNQACQILPRDEVLAFSIGEICYSGKVYDEAVRFYRLASEIKADWSDPFLRLGYAHLAKNENAEAVAQFEKFLALEPQGERASQVKTILSSIRK